jgi:hypothetical protein
MQKNSSENASMQVYNSCFLVMSMSHITALSALRDRTVSLDSIRILERCPRPFTASVVPAPGAYDIGERFHVFDCLDEKRVSVDFYSSKRGVQRNSRPFIPGEHHDIDLLEPDENNTIWLQQEGATSLPRLDG